MLLLYRGKPLLHSSSSADNKYRSMCLSLELAPVDFGPGEDKALRRGGNDAVKPLVIPFCRLQEIQFMSEADRLERVWQKVQESRCPCGEEGSDTKQHTVLGRLLQAVAVMGTVSNPRPGAVNCFPTDLMVT